MRKLALLLVGVGVLGCGGGEVGEAGKPKDDDEQTGGDTDGGDTDGGDTDGGDTDGGDSDGGDSDVPDEPCDANSVNAGGDVLCYQQNGGGTFSYTEAADADALNLYGKDPMLFAGYLSSQSRTQVILAESFVAFGNEPPFNQVLSFELSGNTAGTYTLAPGGADHEVHFVKAGQSWGMKSSASGGGGTVVVTEMGGVSGRVKGTFDVVLCAEGNNGLNCSTTVHLVGAFDVQREANDRDTCSVDAGALGGDAMCYVRDFISFTRVEASAGNPYGFDPGAVAFKNLSKGTTQVAMVDTFTGAGDPPFAHMLTMGFPGAGTGTFDLTTQDSEADLFYGGNRYRGGSEVLGSSGSIIVGAYGAAGGRVKGSFELRLCKDLMNGDYDCDQKVNLRGAFDVELEADGWVPGCDKTAAELGGDVGCWIEEDGLPQQVVETADADPKNFYHADPAAIAVYDTERQRLTVAVVREHNPGGSDNGLWSEIIGFELSGATPGTYFVGGSDADFQFFSMKDGENFDVRGNRCLLAGADSGLCSTYNECYFDSFDNLCKGGDSPRGSGRIDVSSVAGRIKASFDVEACNSLEVCKRLQGTFDVTREADDYGQSCTLPATSGDRLCYARQYALAQFTETASANPYGVDPYITVQYAFEDYVMVSMGTGWNDVAGEFEHLLRYYVRVVPGAEAGTYDDELDEMFAMRRYGDLLWDTGGGFTSAVVTFDQNIVPGQTVTGAFDLVLCAYDEDLGQYDCNNDKVELRGQFSAEVAPPGDSGFCDLEASGQRLCRAPVLFSEIETQLLDDPTTYSEAVGVTPYGYDPVVLATVMTQQTPEPDDDVLRVAVLRGFNGVRETGFDDIMAFELPWTGAGTTQFTGSFLRENGCNFEGEAIVSIAEDGGVGGDLKVNFVSFYYSNDIACDDVTYAGGIVAEREADDFNYGCTVTPSGYDSWCYTKDHARFELTEQSGGSPYGYDPLAVAFYEPVRDRTEIYLVEGYDGGGSQNIPFNRVIGFELPGRVFDGGAHEITEDFEGASVTYKFADEQFSADGSTDSSFTISIPAGLGAGDARATFVVGGACLRLTDTSDCNDRIDFQGAFDIDLELDYFVPGCDLDDLADLNGGDANAMCYGLGQGDAPTVVERAADANPENAYGFDPYTLAVRYGDEAMVALVQDHVPGDYDQPFRTILSLNFDASVADGVGLHTMAYTGPGDSTTSIGYRIEDGLGNVTEYKASNTIDSNGDNPEPPEPLGAINVVSFATGGKATGYFRSKLCLVIEGEEPSCDEADSIYLEGAFVMDREDDGFNSDCIVFNDNGSGGDDGDNFCMAVNAAVYQRDELLSDANPYGGDPFMAAFYSYREEAMVGGVVRGYNGVMPLPFDEMLNFAIPMNAQPRLTGAFTAADGAKLEFRYQDIQWRAGPDVGEYLPGTNDPDPFRQSSVDFYVSRNDTRLQVSYSVRLCNRTEVDGDDLDTEPDYDCGHTLELQGAFDIAVEEDQYAFGCEVSYADDAADVFCLAGETTPEVFTEAVSLDSQNPYGYEPIAFSTVLTGGTPGDTSDDTLVMAMATDFTSYGANPPFDTTIFMELAGPTPVTFPTVYQLGAGQPHHLDISSLAGGWYINENANAEAVVVFHEFGTAEGSVVRGYFEGELCPNNGPCNPRRYVSGSFDIRANEPDFNQTCSVTLDTTDDFCYARNFMSFGFTAGADTSTLAFRTGGTSTTLDLLDLSGTLTHGITLNVPLTAMGSYTMDASSSTVAQLYYTLDSASYGAVHNGGGAGGYQDGEFTVNFTEYGPVGGRIRGNVVGRLCDSSPALDCDVAETDIYVEFDVERFPDQ